MVSLASLLCLFHTSKPGTVLFFGHIYLENVKLFLYLLRAVTANLLSVNKF